MGRRAAENSVPKVKRTDCRRRSILARSVDCLPTGLESDPQGHPAIEFEQGRSWFVDHTSPVQLQGLNFRVPQHAQSCSKAQELTP
jgi:hypothetical protein